MSPTTSVPDAEQAYATLKQALQQAVQASMTSTGAAGLALVGIHTGGAWIADRLAKELGIRDIGFLDISFYRDDFEQIGLHPRVKPTAIPFELEGRQVVLIDDVLFTGRTIRAAMNALFDYGRPSRIDLAVLVDRTTAGADTRELPIAPTWSGTAVRLPRATNLVLSREGAGFHLAMESR